MPGIVLRYVEREARAQGVILNDCSLDFSLDEVRLSSCAFELVDVPGISGSLGEVTIALENFEAKEAVVNEAAIVVRELPKISTAERIPSWLEQRAKFGKGAKIPIRIVESRLDLFGTNEAGKPDPHPLVTLTKLEYDSNKEAVAAHIVIGGLIAGTVKHKGTRSELDLHLKLSPETRGRFSVETQNDGAEVRADFQGLPLALFAMPPFVNIPALLQTVQIDGQLYALVPFGLDPKGVRGDFRLSLTGMPMPVPREIQGLVYGPVASLDGKFKLHPNNQKMDISKLTLKSGSLQLSGNAQLELEDGSVPLQAQLSGNLSCGAILESAARAHTDSPLAIGAARLARKLIKGGVDIIVALEADLLALEKARLLRTIGVGCGLEPLPVPEGLKDLPERIRKGLPRPPNLGEPPKLGEPPDRGGPPLFELPKPPKFELPKLPGLGGKKELEEGEGEPGEQ